jgi:hypothetical protein
LQINGRIRKPVIPNICNNFSCSIYPKIILVSSFRLFDNPLLDIAVPSYTGIKRVNGVLGYKREQFIEVSQDLPLKMNLLGLDYRVAVFSGT